MPSSEKPTVEANTPVSETVPLSIFLRGGGLPQAKADAPTAPTTPPPDALHALVAKLPWSPPRWVEITPEIDQKLNRMIDIELSYRQAPIDALTAIEGLILSNALAGGSARSDAVH